MKACGERGLKSLKYLLSEGAVVAMTGRPFQYEDDLSMTVLEIMGHYQPIPTMDIWYELGEDDRFEDGVALVEVNDLLSRLENERRIFKREEDKWRLRGLPPKPRQKQLPSGNP
jgi:hypothetical protein